MKEKRQKLNPCKVFCQSNPNIPAVQKIKEIPKYLQENIQNLHPKGKTILILTKTTYYNNLHFKPKGVHHNFDFHQDPINCEVDLVHREQAGAKL